MGGLQVIFYIAVLFFLITVTTKAIKIARMPLHLRWDLYPIPHEKGKGSYGGSYFEELDWWTKPREFSLFNELLEMGKEIIFIQSLYHHNRRLWIFSFPFHFGMYCLIVHMGLLLLGAVLSLIGIDVSSTSQNLFTIAIYNFTIVTGKTGWVLSALGATGMLLSRIFRPRLRRSSVISDYCNLLILLALFITGVYTAFAVDKTFSLQRAYIAGLISFSPAVFLPDVLRYQLWIFTALLFYFPFTHMTHFVGKYFTYHKIRWEDEPNVRGSRIEKEISTALGYRINWSAPHIKSDATWAEAATEEATKSEK